MKIILIRRRSWKRIGIILGTVIALVIGFHFWFVNNAENLLEDLVATRSNGRLKLKVENMKFNYFSRKIELEDVVFYSADSADQRTSYRFSVKNIRLKAKAILPIVFQKQLLIDSLYLDAPNMEVIRLKPADRSKRKDIKDISVPREMGRIYNSIQDAINLLEVNRFEFDNGKFTLINKIDPDQQPFVVTNLHFHVDNLQLDTTNTKDKVLFSDQIVLRTRDQDITFPDGLHRLSFSRFRINIRKQLIEFDSCTISGQKKDNNKSSFSVFFDTLKLINLDFKSLYQTELIKADSVYCLNPKFQISLEAKSRQQRRELPSVDTLVQQFTGDMQLAYIGVINADIDITTYNSGVPSTFSSRGNTFEMRGLTIDHHLTNPVSIDAFAMAIRDYENFLKDSSYALRFDSILILENQVLLSNFSVNSRPGQPARNIHVSQFALDELSWSHLIFDKTLKAREATLYNPTIIYTQGSGPRKKERNIFQSLGGLNDIMELDRLRIVNGNIKMNLSNNIRLDLENAYLYVKSQVLLETRKFDKLEQSVEELKFAKALLRIKGLLIELRDAKFTGISDQLSVRYARAYTGRQTVNASANDILLDAVIFDEDEGIINARGVSWQHAKVEINENPKREGAGTGDLTINLENINVKNTNLLVNFEDYELSAFLDVLSATSITESDKLTVNGLRTSGKRLEMLRKNTNLKIDAFDLNDMGPSKLENIFYKQNGMNDSLVFSAPAIIFTPNVTSLMNAEPQLNDLRIYKPSLVRVGTGQAGYTAKISFPKLYINKAEIERPSLVLHNQRGDSSRSITWEGDQNLIRINRMVSSESSLKVDRIWGDLSGIQYRDYDGKKISSGDGKFDVDLQDLVFSGGDLLNWSATLKKADVKNFRMDSIGKLKSEFFMESAFVSNLAINNENVKDAGRLVRESPRIALGSSSGVVRNSQDEFKWFNLSLDNENKSISLDSFSYHPVVSREEFVAASKWQTDYMTFRSGKLTATGFDAGQYTNDSILRFHVFTITDPRFTTYRDKRPPFRAGFYKDLPTGLIKKIPFPISIDTVKLVNGEVVYTELNDKTGEEGAFPVKRMSGDIFPIRNFDLTKRDTLRIRINGYLMDSAWLRLRVRESYLDSLGGFQLTLRMKPGSLTFLNPALAPLASVRLQSGILDTLTMRAVGQDFLSLGEMRMFYHDLKVQFLRNGNEAKKGFLTGLKTFIANSFVIRKQNTRHVGTVYFPRIQDRSFINYYLKMALSGVATSMGAKKNRKLLKNYRKELNERQLPQIDFD